MVRKNATKNRKGKRKPARKRALRLTRTISTAVRKEVRKSSETKHFVQSYVNLTLDQRLETGNQQAFLFQPDQGTAQDERVGNSVFLKGIAVRGVFTVMSNMDHPHIMRLVCYRLKNSYGAPSDAQLNKMMTLGATSTHLGETLINTIRPFNRDLFTIVKTKMVKMAKADHAPAQSNNDYIFTYVAKWWIPVNKNIVFDDDNTVPQNWGLYFGGVAVRADGTIADPQSAVIKYSQDMVYYYKDA